MQVLASRHPEVQKIINEWRTRPDSSTDDMFREAFAQQKAVGNPIGSAIKDIAVRRLGAIDYCENPPSKAGPQKKATTQETILCPRCNKLWLWQVELAGQTAICPHCRGLFTYPASLLK